MALKKKETHSLRKAQGAVNAARAKKGKTLIMSKETIRNAATGKTPFSSLP